MKSLSISIFTILVFAGAALPQGAPSKPRAILVGLIGNEAGYNKAAAPAPANDSIGTATDTEARAWELMNAQRSAVGLSSLQWDESLVALARMHSASMASGKYFSHKDLDGGYVDDRAARLGVNNWIAIGENIAFMKGFADPASTAVEKWMRSPSHKKNMLNGNWRLSAIGAAVGEDGAVYFTQIFIY